MDLSFVDNRKGPLSLSEIFLLEGDTSSFLLNVLKNVKLADNNKAIDVSVSIREVTAQKSDYIGETIRVVDGIVSCTHISDGTPIDLDTVLMKVVNAKALPYTNAKLSFRPYKDNLVLGTGDDGGRTAADKTLTAFTVFLACMLIVTASVLLYVSGGWNVCQQKVSNCLFEEVEEDDEEFYDNKSSFQVESMRDEEVGVDATDGEDDYMEDDDESVETGVQTNPTGILGATNPHSKDEDQENGNPAAGLGVKTPGPRSGYHGGDETPLSESNGNQRPLGITSMREMPDNNTQSKGGLANMIMQRFTHYSGSTDEN